MKENATYEQNEESQSPVVKTLIQSLLGCEIQATLSDGRVVLGTFKCLDRLKNIIMSDAVETRYISKPSGQATEPVQRHLGLVLVPGQYLVKVEVKSEILQQQVSQITAEDGLHSESIQSLLSPSSAVRT
mmetsp:Transcript_38632/g.48801  ORF Transcript_38632/g.48801 Transcript_38632/m.48801 type:complete len:130 (-) Transcript_38632:65-454(-)